MTQSVRITRPSRTAQPTPTQQRAYRFVSAAIKAADASVWHGGYIHGLIQALIMANGLTLNQASELEQAQERASCNAYNQRTLRRAA